MLVLTRYAGEGFTITTKSGEVIYVTIKDVRAGRVTVGFIADKSTIIDRDETVEKKKGNYNDNKSNG